MTKAPPASHFLIFGNRINVDIIALVSLQGNDIEGISTLLESSLPFQVFAQEVIQGDKAPTVILLKGELYQVILLYCYILDSPAPIITDVVSFKLSAYSTTHA